MTAAVILFVWSIMASALPFIRGREAIASEGAGADSAPVS